MPSVSGILFFLWLVVMCLLSSLDEIDVCVELLSDDVWESGYDKTYFLSVGADNFDWLCL